MKQLKGLTILIIISLALAFTITQHQEAQAQAVNDDFESALIITDLPFNDETDTSLATTGFYDPYPCGYYPYKSVWYSFTPIMDMFIRISTEGSNYYTAVGIYTGDYGYQSEIGCSSYNSNIEISLSGGVTYYVLIVSIYESYPSPGSNILRLSLTQLLPPNNDNFINAMVVNEIPYSQTVDNTTASIEINEPNPSCIGDQINRTIWYAYTPSESGTIAVEKEGFYYSFIAIYTGTSLNSLEPLRCEAYGFNRFTIIVDPEVTYYFQLGGFTDWSFGDITLRLYVPPPPIADYWYNPGDPSQFDIINFCDNSYDPVWAGFNNFWWDFGDGTLIVTDNGCVSHQFLVDGDYTVWHKVQTSDGRSAEITRDVSVRTHDVAITKFDVPQSASVGQTRSITIGIRNNNYPERVVVELYKSTPYGFTFIGASIMDVPVRPSNRTTNFSFNYTFTIEDAKAKKVTFKAVAYLESVRDALPADNEAISLPTKVGGYKPYSATLINPSNTIGLVPTFGLLATSLLAGLALFFDSPLKWLIRKE